MACTEPTSVVLVVSVSGHEPQWMEEDRGVELASGERLGGEQTACRA